MQKKLINTLNRHNGNICFVGETDAGYNVFEVDRAFRTISSDVTSLPIYGLCHDKNNRYLVSFGNNYIGKFEDGVLNDKYILTSDDNLSFYPAQQGRWNDIAYGNGLFVAVGSEDFPFSQIMFSEDGNDWTAKPSPQPNKWESITYGNGKFVAVSSNDAWGGENGLKRVMVSEDGKNWFIVNTPSAIALKKVAYGEGRFVAISSNSIISSKDGLSWTNPIFPDGTESLEFISIAYGGGIWAVLSTDGTIVRGEFEDDRQGWKVEEGSGSGYGKWQDIIYGQNKFVAISRPCENISSFVMYSYDAKEWHISEAPFNYGWSQISYGNGEFVVVGERVPNAQCPDIMHPVLPSQLNSSSSFSSSSSGTDYNFYMISQDGINWALKEMPEDTWVAITHGANKFISIANSSDLPVGILGGRIGKLDTIYSRRNGSFYGLDRKNTIIYKFSIDPFSIIWSFQVQGPKNSSQINGSLLVRESDETILYYDDEQIFLIGDLDDEAVLINRRKIGSGNGNLIELSSQSNPSSTFLRWRVVEGEELIWSSSTSSSESDSDFLG